MLDAPRPASLTVAGAAVGLLALDRDGDGGIDHLGELFGQTVSGRRRPEGTANSFLDLAAFDRPEHGGNGDGLISAADAVFARLRLWVDANHDGVSQPGELLTLAQAGIDSIELSPQPIGRRDAFGNVFRYRAIVHLASGRQTTVWDVFLVARANGGAPVAGTAWSTNGSGTIPAGLAWLGASLAGLTLVGLARRRPRRRLIDGLRPTAARVGITGVGTACAVLLWPAAGFGQAPQVVEYYDVDAIGSVRAVTDAQGQVVARHDYLPFGEELNPQTPPHDKKLFTGQERDFETGQDDVGARQLRTDLGRFLAPDPMSSVPRVVGSQGLNAYAYVRNNPLGLVDPSGLDPWRAESPQEISPDWSPTDLPAGAVFDQNGLTSFLLAQEALWIQQGSGSGLNSTTEAQNEQHQYDLVVERTNTLLAGATDENGDQLDARDHLDSVCRLAGGNCQFLINRDTRSDVTFADAINTVLGEAIGDTGAHGGLAQPTHRVGFYISLHHNNDALHIDHFNGANFPAGTLLHAIVDVVIGSVFYGTQRAFPY